MAAKFFVRKVEQCSACNGRKYVEHPAWTEYWKENKDKQPMSLEEDRKWFEDHGWYHESSMDIRTDGTPDEEIYCPECEGQGEIESEVDLIDILPELIQTINLKAE